MSASKSRYGRRPPPAQIIRDQSVPLAFQLVDLDYVQTDEGVRIRLFGTTREGNSVCCSVSTYVPYFYIKAPKHYRDRSQLQHYMFELNQRLMKAHPERNGLSANIEKIVSKIEEVRGASIMNYTNDMNQLFLKISVVAPRMFNFCRNALPEVVQDNCQFFESNIDFELRFMTDYDIVGCCWIEIPARAYKIVSSQRETVCQIEATAAIGKMIVHQPTEEPYGDIAPLRILSFDIECSSDPGVFPTPNKNPIIQIGCVGKEQGSMDLDYKVCFVLGSCTSIRDAHIVACDTEQELLKKWSDFVREVDPDFFTGFNIQNFDFAYIFDRSKHLKIDNYVMKFTRLTGGMCKMRSNTFSSAQMGTRTNKLIDIDGRVVFDVYQVVLREYKLRSYSLNNVSYHFLREQKDDVEHNQISVLHAGDSNSRAKLAMYCMKDAELPVKLLDKLMLIINYIEMARVTGVPINFLINRGQQIRILSQMLRKAKSMNYYLPVIERSGDDEGGYEGATVIEPKRGFYNQPIATLDFASLYPSIMIAHNLCYTTVMIRPHENFVEGTDYIVTPTNNYFVTEQKKRGLLPIILEDLIVARKRAKDELKKATDPLKKIVLNGRQLAIKVTTNSVYGFTGAVIGKLPCLEISQSVTGFGRQMIDLTQHAVENTYKKGVLGMTKDSQVIYGDTDSVMVDFGVETVAEAMKLGAHAAESISKTFKAPIKLEFEKVYCPYLLIQKKRYAGLHYTKPDIHDKIDTKGLETVRRDNCPLVSDVMTSVLELLLIHRDASKALDYAKSVINSLLRNQVDISQLIITKELTKTNDNYNVKQAHTVLAERMRKRDAGSAPKLGDRVPYVIISKGSKTPAYEKAEEPMYVLKNKLPIDTTYYLQNQLLKPLCRIFDPITNNQAERILTTGEHARVRTQVVSNTSGMGMFIVKVASCVGCRTLMKQGGDSPLCKTCEPRFPAIYMEKMEEVRLAQHAFGRLWSECQNCTNQLVTKVNCAAIDCPIFYMREKVRADLEEKTKIASRFSYYNERHKAGKPL